MRGWRAASASTGYQLEDQTGYSGRQAARPLPGRQSRFVASDWSDVIISNLPFSLTRSRGEYLRVVKILEMVE